MYFTLPDTMRYMCSRILSAINLTWLTAYCSLLQCNNAKTILDYLSQPTGLLSLPVNSIWQSTLGRVPSLIAGAAKLVYYFEGSNGRCPKRGKKMVFCNGNTGSLKNKHLKVM